MREKEERDREGRDLAIARALAEVVEGILVAHPDWEESHPLLISVRAIIADVDRQLVKGGDASASAAVPGERNSVKERTSANVTAGVSGKLNHRPQQEPAQTAEPPLSPRAALIAAVRAGIAEGEFPEFVDSPYTDEQVMALVPEAARETLIGNGTLCVECAEDHRLFYKALDFAFAKAAAIAREYAVRLAVKKDYAVSDRARALYDLAAETAAEIGRTIEAAAREQP